MIGGFAIEHIKQQVGFGGGPGTPSRALPTIMTSAASGDALRTLRTAPTCEASVTVSNPWPCGYRSEGSRLYCANISMIFKNWGDTAIPAPWTLHMNSPSYISVRGAWSWNASATDGSGNIDGSVGNAWQSLPVGGEPIPSLGGVFTGSIGTSTAFVPANVAVNKAPCIVITLSGQGDPANQAPRTVPIIVQNIPPAPPSPPSPAPLPPQPSPPPAPPAPPCPPPLLANAGAREQRALNHFAFTVPPILQPVSIDAAGTGLLGVDGQPLVLKGINWFGYEDGNTAPDGIWYGSTALSRDVATIVRRMKLLGFNAVRLPFSFSDLLTLPPQNFNWKCDEVSDQQLLDSTTAPDVIFAVGVKVDSTLPFSPGHNAGSCNDYLPSDSTFARFLWNVHMLAANGMYVLIDNHSNWDTTILTDYAAWIMGWKRIMSNIALDPVSKAFVMYDILNEPDSQGLGWDFMTKAYLDIIQQGQEINPDAIYFVEGCGQGKLGANWGDGFVTDPSLVQLHTVNDPTAFFTAVVKNDYKVVVSPHVYPPTITFAQSAFTGPAFWTRLSYSFGYFNTGKGFCTAAGQCKNFPVIIGEFGSRYLDERDTACLNDFALYMQNSGPAADGKHAAITSWFWWAWNANSGDTGGIVDDDWTTILWSKVDYLASVGLAPWYTQLSDAAAMEEVLASAPPPPPPPPPAVSTKPPLPPPPPPPPLEVITPQQPPSPAPGSPPLGSPPAPGSAAPTAQPTAIPTSSPTDAPGSGPTEAPSPAPTEAPTAAPTTEAPTTEAPTMPPTTEPHAAKSVAVQPLERFTQCGGRGAGCTGDCSDGMWPDVQCASGDACIRQNEWYHQCLPADTSTPAPVAAPTSQPTSSADRLAPSFPLYSQCGGRSNCPSDIDCGDVAWGGCASGSCQRQNEWYYQCL